MTFCNIAAQTGKQANVAPNVAFDDVSITIKARQVDPVKLIKPQSAARNILSIAVKQPRTKRLDQTDTAIVDAGITATDQDMPCPCVERRLDQFTDTTAGCETRIAAIAGNQRQASRRC